MDQISQPRHSAEGSSRAFTLVELLVVMAIIVVIVAISAPVLNSALSGNQLTRAGLLVADQIAQARQEAVAKSREVQVRFYNLKKNDPKGWCGVQVWRVEQAVDKTLAVPVSKMEVFPANVCISADPDLSPLLTADTTVSGTVDLPAYGTVAFQGFRYRPNGATDRTITSSNSFLTIQSASAAGKPPSNYFTVQVNPITGKITVFRP